MKLKSKKVIYIFIGAILLCIIISFAIYRIKINKIAANIESYVLNEKTTIYDKDKEVYAQISLSDNSNWIKYPNINDEFKKLGWKDKKICKILTDNYFDCSDISKNMMSLAIKKSYEGNEICEMVLNTIYYEHGVFGIKMASKYYFNKSYEKLDDKENKALFDITKGIMEGTNISEIKKNHNIDENKAFLCNDDYYVDSVIKEVAIELINSGYDEDEAYNQIYCNSINIYGCVDKKIQKMLDKKYEKDLFNNNGEGIQIQSGMVIMDYEGHILAVEGGCSQDRIKNRATSVCYQVGSTIKPVSIYSLALEKKLINFSTLIPDKQQMIRCNDGEYKEWPSNSDGKYEGDVTVTKALQKSKNTVAVNIGKIIGEEEIYKHLQNQLGFDNLAISEYGESDLQLSALALGYFSKGITLEKLVSLYEMFGNGGKYYGSSTFNKVTDKSGNAIICYNQDAEQVISSENASIMNRLLYNNVYGEDGIAGKAKSSKYEVAGKTGTVSNYGKIISKFFVGMTPEYIAGVWTGYDNQMNIPKTKYEKAIEVWSSIMNDINYSKEKFSLDKKVIRKDYCSKSGLLAGENCKKTYSGYYTSDNIPKECSQCQ